VVDLDLREKLEYLNRPWVDSLGNGWTSEDLFCVAKLIRMWHGRVVGSIPAEVTYTKMYMND
jgi:hypothetical protein